MSFFVWCLLCLVQGFTEFLPVSSSGHLILIEQLFGVEDNLLLINLFLHLATLLAVIVVYRKTIWKLIKKPFQPLMYKLCLSTLITLVFAFSYKYFNLESFSYKIYGICFLVTAALLMLTYSAQRRMVAVKKAGVSIKSAIVSGIAQGFAVFPGLSRSGTTIASLILAGNSESESSEYSFLLSIPIIVGGFVLELISSEGMKLSFYGLSVFECAAAFVMTFIVSIISLKITIKMLKNNKFNWFACYLFVLGLIVTIFTFAK